MPPTHSGCPCPPPIRDKDGDWFQDTHPDCPIHRGSAPNLGPRGSMRENVRQERTRLRRPTASPEVPRTFRPESSAERTSRKAARKAQIADMKERLANTGPPRFPTED